MQLQLFSRPPVQKKNVILETITPYPDYAPTSIEQLLSDRYITQNGMLLLRQSIASAYRKGDWKNYLKLVRSEIDMKKGRITLAQALKEHALLSQGL